MPVKPHLEKEGTVHTYWMYSILVETPEMRENLREYLKNKSIETRPTFYPVHTMPMFSQKYQKLPIAEYLGWRGINLPSFPELSDTLIKDVCMSITEFYSRGGR